MEGDNSKPQTTRLLGFANMMVSCNLIFCWTNAFEIKPSDLKISDPFSLSFRRLRRRWKFIWTWKQNTPTFREIRIKNTCFSNWTETIDEFFTKITKCNESKDYSMIFPYKFHFKSFFHFWNFNFSFFISHHNAKPLSSSSFVGE